MVRRIMIMMMTTMMAVLLCNESKLNDDEIKSKTSKLLSVILRVIKKGLIIMIILKGDLSRKLNCTLHLEDMFRKLYTYIGDSKHHFHSSLLDYFNFLP